MEGTNESIGSASDISVSSSFLALATSSFRQDFKVPRVASNIAIGHSSEFGDSDCGEPLEVQHILLDFRPSEADDDFAQRKCCAFWKYINSRCDLQDLMVKPEMASSNAHDRESTDNAASGRHSTSCPSSPEHVEKPMAAVSMLQIVENKGLIDRAFEAKMQQSRCTLGSHEYEFGKKTAKTKCKCPGPCSMCLNARQKVSDAKSLCEELEAWDMKHPKSLDPPGHPPALSHSVMQRRVVN